jgi:hypothetical protein
LLRTVRTEGLTPFRGHSLLLRGLTLDSAASGPLPLYDRPWLRTGPALNTKYRFAGQARSYS